MSAPPRSGGEPPRDGDAQRAWLAPRDAQPTPGEPLDPAPRSLRQVLGWIRLAFVAGSAVVLLMLAAVALALTHASTAAPPAPRPPAVPTPRVVPFTDVDWPGYAPDAPLTGGAPTHGDLAVYRAVAERLLGEAAAESMGYTVWAAIDGTGAIDFESDPHGSVTFDYHLPTDRCVSVTLGRGYQETTLEVPCEGEPQPFAPPAVHEVMALARASCPAIFEGGSRPRVVVRHAFRWMRVSVVDPSLPDLSFTAIATRDARLRGRGCGAGAAGRTDRATP